MRQPTERAGTDAERRGRALAAVEAVEATELALPVGTRASLLASARIIARHPLPERVRTMLPPPRCHPWDPEDPALDRLQGGIAADLVVRAKYDLGARVKLRAGYADRGLVLGVLPATPFGRCGASRTIEAHAIVGRHAPDLAPPLVAFGEVDGAGRYVVERWIDGNPLLTPSRLAAAVPEIVDGLRDVHRGHGTTRVRLARWAPELASEWSRVRHAGLVPAEIADTVATLIDRDATLLCSWTHGDPVSSNAIRTATGIVLIDWENAATAPVMVDGAKLHLFADEPQATLETVLRGLAGAGTTSAPRHYSPAEELALVHARRLAAHGRRAAQLAGHPQQHAHVRRAGRQVQRLAEVLAA